MTLAGTHLFKIQSSCICLVGMCAYPQYNLLIPGNFFQKRDMCREFSDVFCSCASHMMFGLLKFWTNLCRLLAA